MLKEITLTELAPSPTNPRKTFDQVKLEELAASIREKGVLEPILVRPIPPKWPVRDGEELRPGWDPKKAKYEVVAGERRFRAAGMAEVEKVPCILRDLTDVEVLEIQTIENLQRDDVHPLEEAEGYVALMKAGEYDEGRIAERIGKARAYVYRRVQLVNLIPELKKIFMDGEMGVGHAEILAVLKPEEQARVLGTNHRGEITASTTHSGLFRSVAGHIQTSLGIEGRRNRKPVSIRELQTYIDDHVRFDPTTVDLPNLFPETHQVLEDAGEEELKVIHITRDHQLKPETRKDGQRTYSVVSWKRADGKPEPATWEGGKATPSKPCEHSVLGVVVTGPGRGQAFAVCTAKKKCKVHWGEEQRAAKRRAKGNTDTGPSRWEVEQEKRRELDRKAAAERERWKKAAPALLTALAEALATSEPLDAMEVVLEAVVPRSALPGSTKNLLADGMDLEGKVRRAAYLAISNNVSTWWPDPKLITKALKRFGVGAVKIVNEVAPKPKTKRAPAKKPKKPAPKKKVKA